MIQEEIKTINNTYKSELKEKASKFLGFAFPVESENEALSILDRIKKEYYDASHHCYAYKLTDSLIKYSDAGEPSGTAGIRILNAIEHFDIANILIVIVRYFGGTKLGIGGLGRAYYETACRLLEKAEIRKKYLYQKILITLDFQFTQKVYHLFNDSENKILNVNYSDKANFECIVKPAKIDQIIEKLNNFTNGKAEVSPGKSIYC
jgi:uncharacterized YigZ family protein